MQENYDNFYFDKTNGLFYDGQFIADFDLCVIGKETIQDAVGNSQKKRYLVEAFYIDGRSNICKWVDNLKKLDYFEVFEINDCFLPHDSRKLLTFKLMCEAGQVQDKIKVDSRNGLQVIDGNAVYVLAEHVLWGNCISVKTEIITHDTLQPNIYTDKTKMLELCSYYINLLPGITDILFFGSLFAVVKPFAEQLGISSGLILSLVAPAGHLKTTLVRNYALWMMERENQEIGIYSRKRDQSVLDMIDRLSGQNVLLDDLRKIPDANEAKRQEKRLDIVCRHVNAEKGCANVILTGETMEKMGIFSCIDRIFQIRMPEMCAEEIEKLKEKVSVLSSGLMPSIAVAFVQALMNRYNDVLNDIKDFYNRNSIDRSAAGTATRIYRHASFIRMTAHLFVKYLFGKEMVVNNYESSLADSITEQIQMQQAELEKIRLSEQKHDYIIDLYEILNAENKYIRLCSKQSEYNANAGNACLLMNGKVYITSDSLKRAFFRRYEKYVPVKQILDLLEQEGILETEAGSKGRQKNYMGKKHYVMLMSFLVCYVKNNGYPVHPETYKKHMRELS